MPGTVPFSAGRAGASAAAKAEQIRAQRNAAGARRSPMRRVLRMIYGPSESERRLLQRERNWQNGADGERILAGVLERRCRDAVFLHDLGIPARRANIDHVAFAPSGIHVIDAKRYRGRIRVLRFGAETRLTIAGRNKTGLITGLEGQVALVEEAMRSIAPDVPVYGCLCFVAPQGWLADADLPMFRTLRVKDVPLYSPRRLAKRLSEPGPVSEARARELRHALGLRFPPASPPGPA